jgi:hypothetical protein
MTRAIAIFKDSKIFFSTNVIFGLPGEDEKELLKTLEFCHQNKSDFASQAWLRYYPRLQINKLARDMGYLTDKDIENMENAQAYKPFKGEGSTYNKEKNKISVFFTLSTICLPRPLVLFLIKHKTYRYFPDIRKLMTIGILIMFFLKKVFRGKKQFYFYFTPISVVKYYIRFLWESLTQNFFNFRP